MAVLPINPTPNGASTIGDIKGSLLEIANDIRLDESRKKHDKEEGLLFIDDYLLGEEKGKEGPLVKIAENTKEMANFAEQSNGFLSSGKTST